MTEQKKTFGNLIAEVNKILTKDAKSICESIVGYKQEPIKTPSAIKLEVFDKVVPFNEVPQNDTEIKKALYSQRGVYIFLITSACARDKNFNSVYYGAKLNDTSISWFNPGDILYVGKAKSFLTRMNQHFSVASTYNHTGSLKILSPQREVLIGHFTVYAFCIKSDYKNYYDMIASAVESVLREELKPLVGI